MTIEGQTDSSSNGGQTEQESEPDHQNDLSSLTEEADEIDQEFIPKSDATDDGADQEESGGGGSEDDPDFLDFDAFAVLTEKVKGASDTIAGVRGPHWQISQSEAELWSGAFLNYTGDITAKVKDIPPGWLFLGVTAMVFGKGIAAEATYWWHTRQATQKTNEESDSGSTDGES